MDPRTESLAQQVLDGSPVQREDALYIATSSPFPDILYWANEIRSRCRGDVISLCAIANARSGACTEDCAFCAQSASFPTDAPVYDLRPVDELVAAARRAEAAGADAFCIVTSGRGLEGAGGGEFDSLLERARAVRGAIGIELHVSVGSLDREGIASLREAGVTSANHNVETSERFFQSICTTHAWEERARGVELLVKEGMSPCSGGIFGMGEFWEDRVDMALALRALGVTRVPVNFLNPVPGTPLGERPVMSAREALRVIAVMRFVLPEADIRTCGGRERVLGPLQSWMFNAGASATMLGDYLTTKGRDAGEDLALINALGLRTRAGTR